MQNRIDPQQVHEMIVAGRAKNQFLLGIIPAGFDPVQLASEYQSIIQQHAVRHTPRADGSTLRSISLTHRPNAVEPLYDGNNTQFDPATNRKLFLERDFSEFNQDFLNTAFYQVYRQLPFQAGRMRLNLLPPLTVFTMHRDSAPRAHIALVTNPNCFLMSGDGQAYHVPADGSIYIFDTTLPHTALNASREDRFHLTMPLADEE